MRSGKTGLNHSTLAGDDNLELQLLQELQEQGEKELFEVRIEELIPLAKGWYSAVQQLQEVEQRFYKAANPSNQSHHHSIGLIRDAKAVLKTLQQIQRKYPQQNEFAFRRQALAIEIERAEALQRTIEQWEKVYESEKTLKGKVQLLEGRKADLNRQNIEHQAALQRWQGFEAEVARFYRLLNEGLQVESALQKLEVLQKEMQPTIAAQNQISGTNRSYNFSQSGSSRTTEVVTTWYQAADNVLKQCRDARDEQQAWQRWQAFNTDVSSFYERLNESVHSAEKVYDKIKKDVNKTNFPPEQAWEAKAIVEKLDEVLKFERWVNSFRNQLKSPNPPNVSDTLETLRDQAKKLPQSRQQAANAMLNQIEQELQAKRWQVFDKHVLSFRQAFAQPHNNSSLSHAKLAIKAAQAELKSSWSTASQQEANTILSGMKKQFTQMQEGFVSTRLSTVDFWLEQARDALSQKTETPSTDPRSALACLAQAEVVLDELGNSHGRPNTAIEEKKQRLKDLRGTAHNELPVWLSKQQEGQIRKLADALKGYWDEFAVSTEHISQDTRANAQEFLSRDERHRKLVDRIRFHLSQAPTFPTESWLEQLIIARHDDLILANQSPPETQVQTEPEKVAHTEPEARAQELRERWEKEDWQPSPEILMKETKEFLVTSVFSDNAGILLADYVGEQVKKRRNYTYWASQQIKDAMNAHSDSSEMARLWTNIMDAWYILNKAFESEIARADQALTSISKQKGINYVVTLHSAQEALAKAINMFNENGQPQEWQKKFNPIQTKLNSLTKKHLSILQSKWQKNDGQLIPNALLEETVAFFTLPNVPPTESQSLVKLVKPSISSVSQMKCFSINANPPLSNIFLQQKQFDKLQKAFRNLANA